MKRFKANMPARGFTLIEILVVIGMLAILSTVVLVAVNPLRQFAQARNSQREANVAAILNAVGNRLADNRGIFAPSGSSCDAIPQSATLIASTGYDLRECLVPNYLSEMPVDPSTGSACASASCTGGYSTGYQISQATGTARVTVCAPQAVETGILDDEPFCLTR